MSKWWIREPVIIIGLLVWGSAAHGTVIGYWQFETSPGFVNDSSNNGLTLTNNGSVSAYPLPVSGAGQYFTTTTQGSSAQAADFGSPNSSKYFSVADAPAFTITAATIEAFNNRASNTSGTQYIASQWAASTGLRSWSFGIAGSGTTGLSDNELFLNLSANGTTASLLGSGIIQAAGTDYYSAVQIDASTLTFYSKNLSTGEVRITSVANPQGAPNDSTAPVRIGAVGGGSGSTTSYWTGILDEVRISDTVLSADQLLVVVPEPAGAGLLLAAGLTALARRGARSRTAEDGGRTRTWV